MRQLQIIWFCSLKQNYNLLKQEPKQMFLLYQGYIVLKGKLSHKSSACLQEKKNNCILFLGICSVENITNSRSRLIHKFRNPWETFTSAHKSLVSGRLCICVLREHSSLERISLPFLPRLFCSWISEKNGFEGLHCPAESALFRIIGLGQFSEARIIALFLTSFCCNYPYIMVKFSIVKILNCGLRYGLAWSESNQVLGQEYRQEDLREVGYFHYFSISMCWENFMIKWKRLGEISDIIWEYFWIKIQFTYELTVMDNFYMFSMKRTN